MPKPEEREEKALDSVSQELIQVAQTADVELVWDRAISQTPHCRFGEDGVCCRICSMGPCRIIPGRRDYGVCGATADTIVARNFVRMIAGGAAAHSDHGRAVAINFIKAARGEVPGYEIKDEEKLKQIATIYEIETEGRTKEEIAEDVGNAALQEFGQQTGEIRFISRAP